MSASFLPQPALWLRMTRPGFLTITGVGVLLGLATAYSTTGTLNGSTAALTLLLALLAHAGANVLNDYHDALNGADDVNQQGLFPFSGGSRLIQNRVVTSDHTHRLGWLLTGLVVVGGMVLAWHSGPGLWAIGAAGLLLGWAYSAPPLALMSRGLGEPGVAVAWWLVVIGADYTQRLAFSWLPLLLGLGYGLLIANILLINGFPDAPADAQVGKRTWVVRFGTGGATALYTLLTLAAHGWLLLAVNAGWLPSTALWGLASLPLALAAVVALWRHRDNAPALRPAIGLTIATAVVHGMALSGGLALG